MTLSTDVRSIVIREFVTKLRRLKHEILACSAGAEHLHGFTELPADHAEVIREIGKCKQKVSHALRDVLPGSIWSEGGEYKLIKDFAHGQNTFDYIRTKQEPGTIVWSNRVGENWIDDRSLEPLVISPERTLVPIR